MPQWRPKNYEAGSAAGPSTLRFGIEKSRNLMTVRLANDMGMPIIVEYARRFGVYDNLMPMLSMALGAGETTLLRMVGAYGMIANGGKQIKPTLIDRIQDRYGRTIWQHDNRDCVNCDAREWSGQDEPELVDDRPQIIDPMSAYQMVSIMEGVVQRGTAMKLKVLERPHRRQDRAPPMTRRMAGSSASRLTSWSACISVSTIPRPWAMARPAAMSAAPVVREFFKIALADKPPIPFRAPPGIKLVRVNLKTGLPARPRRPQGHHGGIQADPRAFGCGRHRYRGCARSRVRPGRAASSLPGSGSDPRTAAPRSVPGARQRPGFDIGHRRTLLEANNSETCRRDLAILAARSAISRSEEEMRAETEAVVNDIKQSLTLLRRHL